MLSRKSKITSWRQKIILLMVSLLLGLGVCELIVRGFKLGPHVLSQTGAIRFVDNPRMVYEFIPGAQSVTVDGVIYRFYLNKQGFNNADFTLDKQKNTIRIAILGDSITQGVFVSPDKTFSRKLEDLLNRKAKESQSPVKYEVMNFGVAGYNLTAETEVLKEKALAYKPDIVILNLFHNDNEPIPGIELLFFGNYFGLTVQQQDSVVKKYVDGRDSLVRQFERKVLYKSRLYLLLVNDSKMFIRKKKNGAYDNDMTPIVLGFQEMNRLREQHKFKLLVCIHPGLLYSDHENNFKFASIADSFKFDHFRMASYYQKEVSSPELLQLRDFPRDYCHPNELGHALIAKAMFHELANRRFICFK